MPFVKGKSGNPGGRIKVPADVIEAFRALTPDAVIVVKDLLKNAEREQTRLEAAKVILDRGWGKATEKVEISGPDGEAIKQFVDAAPQETREQWMARKKLEQIAKEANKDK